MRVFLSTTSKFLNKNIGLISSSGSNSIAAENVILKRSFHASLKTHSQKLTQAERESSLERLCNNNHSYNPLFTSWQVMEDQDAIEKTFEFTDFTQAWGFMSQAALIAEKVKIKDNNMRHFAGFALAYL